MTNSFDEPQIITKNKNILILSFIYDYEYRELKKIVFI